MSGSVNFNPVPPPVIPEIFASVLRKQIDAELIEIGNQLKTCGLYDEMTDEIRHWHTQFKAALKLKTDEKIILEEFIGLLQELLIDPLSNVPLDEESLLGTDGKTYGYKSFCLYLISVPIAYRQRSPLNPEDPAKFTVSAHLMVRHMIHWLKKYKADLHSEEIENAYQKLMAHLKTKPSASEKPPAPKKTDPLSDDREERIRQLKERAAKRKQQQNQKKAEFEENLTQLENDLNQMIQQGFAAIHQHAKEVAAMQAAKLEAVQNKDQEQMEILHNAVENLENEIQQLERRNEELKSQIHRIHSMVKEAEKEDLQLQLAINETRQAIKKRKKSWMKDLCTTVAIVGACAFSTWALQGITSFGQMSFLPLEGGAKIRFVITI